jgi:hypothetical protein
MLIKEYLMILLEEVEVDLISSIIGVTQQCVIETNGHHAANLGQIWIRSMTQIILFLLF